MKKNGKIVLVLLLSLMLFGLVNVYAEEPSSSTINEISISGLKYPEIGESAGTNLATVKVLEDANYSIEFIEWTASDDGMYYHGGWSEDITLDEGFFYEYNIKIKANDGFSFATDEEGNYTGSLSISDLNYMDAFIDDDNTLFIIGEPIFLLGEDNATYQVTEGANQEYTKGISTELKFVIDANPKVFRVGSLITIDGQEDDNIIDYSKIIYDEENNSVTLVKDYVDSFTEGTHTIRFYFMNDKIAETTFTILNNNTSEETNTKTEITPPNTGLEKKINSNNIIFLIITLVPILLGGTIIYKKKNN